MLHQLRAQCVQHAPSFLRLPVQITPFPVKKTVIQQLLKWQFRHLLDEGDLDFLTDRWLGVEICDLALRWAVSVKQGKLCVAQRDNVDVWFRGNTNDLLLVAARKIDPDTLFFQRRLVIEGDTELGLEVKNVMDAMELSAMPGVLRTALFQLADFIEAGLHAKPASMKKCAQTTC